MTRLRVVKSTTSAGLGGSGNVNTVSKFTAGTTLGNSSITDDGTTVTTAEALNQGASAAFVLNSSGLPTKSNSISLAGQGFPLILAANTQSKTNLAPTTVSVTPGAAAGSARISVYLDVTTGTTISLTLKVTYKDPAGNSTTDVLVFTKENSAVLLTAAVTADRFSSVWVVSFDNSATAIAVADNAGTYTTCAYRLTVVIEQII